MVTICVVDDDLSVRRSLTNLLRSAGYDVQSYDSGEAFLASPHRLDAPCVLLDLRMNGLQGLEVLRQLKQATQVCPAVICMSAHWDGASLQLAHSEGVAECLRKPFSSEVLLETISRVITQQRDPA